MTVPFMSMLTLQVMGNSQVVKGSCWLQSMVARMMEREVDVVRVMDADQPHKCLKL